MEKNATERYTSSMRTLLWVVVGLNQAILMLKGSLTFARFNISEFAFREQLGHHPGIQAKLFRQAYKQLPLLRTWRIVNLVLGGTLSITLFSYLVDPWALGVLYALFGFTVAALLAKLSFFKTMADSLFIRLLEPILKIVTVCQPFLRMLGSNLPSTVAAPGSKAEFVDQLRRLPSTVLSPSERQQLERVLASGDKSVKDIMTLKKRVVSVEPSATLGPVVLSDLQKSGHGYFPVATKKGQPEGILALSDVADIQTAKQRPLVRDLMSEQFSWVEEDTSLDELTQAFLQEKQYLILVRNLDSEFTGVVTIADLMKHTLGVVKTDGS